MQVSPDTHHWLGVRIRLLCVVAFFGGSLLPPYIPPAALATEDIAVVTTQVMLVEDGFLRKSSALSRQGARRAYAEGIVHTVREGESLERIARRYGVSVDTLRWANALEEETVLRPGDELLILPVDGVLHTVSRGQTLTRIAELYGVPAEDITEQNRLEGDFIVADQELIIPGGKPIIPKKVVPPPKSTSPSPIIAKEGGPPAPPPPSTAPGVLQMPCRGCAITQYYRPGHYALDLQTKGGGPIFAVEDGVVIRADLGWNGGYGNVIEIDHGNDLISLYSHNSEHFVSVGQRVERGQIIARMGNTGLTHGPTGIHLHFEVRHLGIKKNPLLYLQ